MYNYIPTSYTWAMARHGAVRYIISVLEQGKCSEQINLRIPFCYINRIFVYCICSWCVGSCESQPLQNQSTTFFSFVIEP